MSEHEKFMEEFEKFSAEDQSFRGGRCSVCQEVYAVGEMTPNELNEAFFKHVAKECKPKA